MKHALKPVRTEVYGAVLVCTPEHWEQVRSEFGEPGPGRSRGREFLSRTYGTRRVVFVNAGEGIVAVAAATQLAVDRWEPRVLMYTEVSSDYIAGAIEEVAVMNGIPLLSKPVERGPLSEQMNRAFAAFS